MELAVVVEQAEQQRADVRAGPVLVPAEAGDDAVRGALVLDLEHRPLAWLVGRVEPLRDDPVETGALEPVEPVGGEVPLPRRGREVDRRLDPRERRLQPRPPLVLGTSRRSSSPRASRSQPTKLAGVSSASIFTRDAAGWIRSRSASKSSSPSRAITTSPSTTQRSGSDALRGAASSGK